MLNTYPSALQPYLQGSQLIDCSCCSEATTFYVDRGYYLKIAPKGRLAQEARFTQWFYAKSLSVEVVLYLSEDKDYLLTMARLALVTDTLISIGPFGHCGTTSKQINLLTASSISMVAT